MGNWSDRYIFPDAIVTGVAETVQVLEEKLGIPPGTNVRRTRYGSGFDAAYFAVNEDLDITASGIQLLGVRAMSADEPENADGKILHAMLMAYITSQPMYRPLVTHVTAFATHSEEEVQDVIEILKTRNVPHVARIDNAYIGLVEHNGQLHYDPEVDGGIQLEFTYTPALYPGSINAPVMPAEPEFADLTPGSFVRPTARLHLTPNADAVIERLREIVDWPEEGSLDQIDGNGYRAIVIRPDHPLCATFQLIEPTSEDGRAGLAMAKYGPGAWLTRFGVFGLDAKLEDLDRRGTRWQRIEAGPDGERVALNRWDLRGLTFELEDMPVVPRGWGGSRA